MAVFCEQCGNELSPQAVACPACGHPRRSATTFDVPVRRFEPFAAASLACSIANFVFLPLIGAILGVVFGNMAIEKIRHDPTLDGLQVAQAGKIIGYIGIALILLVIFFMMAVCSTFAAFAG